MVWLWNRGARHIFQYDDGEIVGSDIRVLFTPDDRAHKVPEKEIKKALKQGFAGDFRWHLRMNDSRGHAAGDALLQQAAHRMRSVLRDTDFVGRLGGDEFVVLLPDLETPEQGGSVAEHLMEELARLFSVNQGPVQIGASIGISVFPQNARELEELF